jgi:hypothetical protein
LRKEKLDEKFLQRRLKIQSLDSHLKIMDEEIVLQEEFKLLFENSDVTL